MDSDDLIDDDFTPFTPVGPIAVGSAEWRRYQYADRVEAGRTLAAYLRRYARRPDTIILALPRGGVPVARVIADELGLPLDVFVVRKLGIPGHPELAFGAIASGGTRVIDEDLVRSFELSADMIARVTAAEQAELERRERAYRDDLPEPALEGQTVILVDDGLATGATMYAALMALRARHPARIVVAVPVGSPEVLGALETVADEVVCPLYADPLWAVGAWYKSFPDVTDDEVRAALRGELSPWQHG